MRVLPALLAFAIGAAPALAHAQPVDPYADPTPAPAPAPAPRSPKPPRVKNPKVPKKPRGKQVDAGPVDPYADAQPAPDAPQDPYGEPAPPTPAPAPTPPAPPPMPPSPAPPAAEQPSDVDEAVAAALVARARHLLDVAAWADAKQLAVESLVRSPSGASSADAKEIVRVANQHLGIVDRPPPPPADHAVPVTDTGATAEPAVTARAPHDEGAIRGAHVLGGYGFAGGALLGLGVVGAGDGVSEAGADTAGAVVGGLAIGGLAYWLGDRNDLSIADARTIGAGATWGAIDFAFLADAVGGTNVHTTHDEVAVGASLGLALGTLGGIAYAHDHSLSANDVTVIDSFAGMGVVGGLMVGELMQPFASEAYSLNAALGAAGGVAVGLYLAPDHEISSARMLRVDGVAALGAGAPWLLYALVQDSSTTDDERVFGLLSTGGLLAGLYLGFRWTSDYDDKHLGAKPKAVEVGALGFRPATTPLATDDHARGLVVDVLRGTW